MPILQKEHERQTLENFRGPKFLVRQFDVVTLSQLRQNDVAGSKPFRERFRGPKSPSLWEIMSARLINWLPSPENSNPNTIFADQMLFEFLGEGLGVREIRSASATSDLNVPNSRTLDWLVDFRKTIAPHPQPLSPRIRSIFNLEA